MTQTIATVALVVRDYDEALAFYVGTLGFTLVEDTYMPAQDKRWVIVAPPGSAGPSLLLARAVGAEQSSRIGNQTGGRVFLFLHTDDFWRDYAAYRSKGVTFVREASEEPYGTVAVFSDLYGNLWDLVQPKSSLSDRPETPQDPERAEGGADRQDERADHICKGRHVLAALDQQHRFQREGRERRVAAHDSRRDEQQPAARQMRLQGEVFHERPISSEPVMLMKAVPT